jgi:hypothetical protein
LSEGLFVNEAELQQSRTPFGHSLRRRSLHYHKAKGPPESTKGLYNFGAFAPSRSKAHRAFAGSFCIGEISIKKKQNFRASI